ncbi:uncharacterized protein LOC131948710 [Physella acuta]|uniref:uncharacterized protein LOC131948710 n=1 Tax=Physella acuta TaxID=109671 RepID=UPI0027DC74B6|nr:uncharacterized protein LOC131948710 [Physella acuta]
MQYPRMILLIFIVFGLAGAATVVQVEFEEDGPITAIEGSSTSFTCTVSGNIQEVTDDRLQIVKLDIRGQQVLVNGQNVAEPKFYSVFIRRSVDTISIHFSILKVRVADDGKFKCNVKPWTNLVVNVLQEELEIQVIRPPVNIACSNATIDAVNQKIEVTCKSELYPDGICKVNSMGGTANGWRFDVAIDYQQSVDDETGYYTTSCKLRVPVPMVLFGSIYSFNVSIQPNVGLSNFSKSTRVAGIYDASTIRTTLVQFLERSPLYAVIGSTVKLTCQIAGLNPNVSLDSLEIIRTGGAASTLSQGNKVISERNYYNVTISKALDQVTLEFFITKVRIIDDTKFVCHIKRGDYTLEYQTEVLVSAIKIPDPVNCGYPVSNQRSVQIKCSTTSYPAAQCTIKSGLSSAGSFSYQVQYNFYMSGGATGFYTTECSISLPLQSVLVGSYYKFVVQVAPNVADRKNFTVSSRWFIGTPGEVKEPTVDFFTANSESGYITAEPGSDVTFVCGATGALPGSLQLYRSPSNILHTSADSNTLNFVLADVGCSQEGEYGCRVDYSTSAARKILLHVKSCGSGSDATPLSVIVAVCVGVPILGIAFIAAVVILIVCCVRRAKHRRSLSSTPVTRSPGGGDDLDYYNTVCFSHDSVYFSDPPPYSVVCGTKDEDKPPPYSPDISATTQHLAPNYTPPTTQPSAPTYTPPTTQPSAPTYTPPTTQPSAPTYTPPTTQPSAPTYTPPTTQPSRHVEQELSHPAVILDSRPMCFDV